MTDAKVREAQLARLRALMAKTTANGCTEAEAHSAAEMLDKLLAAYEIELDEVEVRSQECVMITIEAIANNGVRYSAKFVAEFCDCRYWISNGTDIAFVGLTVDTEIVEYLMALFKRAIDRESADYTLLNAEYALCSGRGRSEMVHAFKVGLATRLGERLTELKSSRDFSSRGMGHALVVLKKPIVDEAVDSLGIRWGCGSAGRQVTHQGAYVAGRNAAEGVSIAAGVRGGSANGRIGR